MVGAATVKERPPYALRLNLGTASRLQLDDLHV